MAEPVKSEEEAIHEVATYGMGFAAYFIPLSLWVGALMLYFILSMHEYRWTLSPVSTLRWCLANLPPWRDWGRAGGDRLRSADLRCLGLEVLHLTEFYLFNILLSLTSIAIIGFVIARLGTGRGPLHRDLPVDLAADIERRHVPD